MCSYAEIVTYSANAIKVGLSSLAVLDVLEIEEATDNSIDHTFLIS